MDSVATSEIACGRTRFSLRELLLTTTLLAMYAYAARPITYLVKRDNGAARLLEYEVWPVHACFLLLLLMANWGMRKLRLGEDCVACRSERPWRLLFTIGAAALIGRLLLPAEDQFQPTVVSLYWSSWVGVAAGLTTVGLATTAFLMPSSYSYAWKKGVWFSSSAEFKKWDKVQVLRDENGRIAGLAHRGWWSKEAGRFGVPEELAPRVAALLPAGTATPASGAPTA